MKIGFLLIGFVFCYFLGYLTYWFFDQEPELGRYNQELRETTCKSKNPTIKGDESEIYDQNSTSLQIQFQSESETKSETQNQTQNQVQNQIQTPTQFKTDSQTQPSSTFPIQSKIQLQTQFPTETQTETKTRTQIQTQPPTQTPTQTQIPTQTNSQSRTKQQKCYYKNYQLPLQSQNFVLPKIFFLKTYKVGGSTFAGILRNLANEYGKVVLTPPEDHIFMGDMDDFDAVLAHQNVTNKQIDIFCNHLLKYNSNVIHHYMGRDYFQVTLVRHPVSRALSGYFHSRTGNYCTTESTRWVETCVEFQNGIYTALRDRNVQQLMIRDVLSPFDLLMITERFTESLIVFMWKIGLKLTDLLYVNSKTRSPDAELPQRKEKSFIKDVLEMNGQDLRIFELANEYLDKQIAELPPRYMDYKNVLEEMLQEVQDECPYSEDDCYWKDNGCARTCIKNWIKNNIHCL